MEKKHKHTFKMIGGGCMVIGDDKYPCDMEYKCECGDIFELLTTQNGFRNLPESFEKQERSEMHEKTVSDITDASLGINIFQQPES